jgi:hypothetical protein
MVKKESFSIFVKGRGQKVMSAWLERRLVNKEIFSRSGKGNGQESQFWHAWKGMN